MAAGFHAWPLSVPRRRAGNCLYRKQQQFGFDSEQAGAAIWSAYFFGAPTVVIPPPPPPVVTEIPAGRIQRVLYFVTIDGVRFECGSVQEALALLAQAKETARKRAEDQAMWAVAEQERTAYRIPVPKLETPKIDVSSRQLRAAASETRRSIAAIYAHELQIAELRMLLEVAQRKTDEEDTLALFM